MRNRAKVLAITCIHAVVLIGCQESTQLAMPPNGEDINLTQTTPEWPIQVASELELESLGVFDVEWHRFNVETLEIAVGIENRTLFSPSHHVVCGYVHNRQFDGWNRFIMANLEGVGYVTVYHDEDTNHLIFAHSVEDNKPILTFSVSAISDSAPYQVDISD